MTTVHVPWASWYGDERLPLTFPTGWRVNAPMPALVRGLTAAELRQRFARPIGTRPLRALAAGKRTAAIVVDDLTRPTPTARLLPLVLDELRAGGIAADDVRVLVGLATHRPLGRHELLKKLGPLADELTIINHNPYEQLTAVGTTTAGTVVQLSTWYLEAELRITIGCVEPHPAYGFSGGAKLVFPGLAGIESIDANHRSAHLGRGILMLDQNAMRRDAEEAVATVGLDSIVNVVLTGKRQIAELFVGDYIAAHRAAAAYACALYATPIARPADVAVFNAYPKDTELIQLNNAVNAASAAQTTVLREGGVVVIATAASEGPGYHGLANPGGRMYNRPAHPFLQGRPVIVYCPHGRQADLPPSMPAGTRLFRQWAQVIDAVTALVNLPPEVLVFREGPLQIPVSVR